MQVLDYVDGGELFLQLKKEGKFSEARTRVYTAEISLALMVNTVFSKKLFESKRMNNVPLCSKLAFVRKEYLSGVFMNLLFVFLFLFVFVVVFVVCLHY